MKKRKRVRIKYRNVLMICIVIIGIVIGIKYLSQKEDEPALADVLADYVGREEEILQSLEKDYQIVKDYAYSEEYDQGKIMQIEVQENQINVLISKGVVSDDVYREYKVNELGKVPIMMYHGIVDTEDNKYTGGNVDKDGYNRTSKAFREDLEFYYQHNYRMIRLEDYVNGVIDVELGKSPIILTFDDGNKNNFHVLGREEDGTLNIDPNCAVGILEEFKNKHPSANVTATFFLMNDLFNQKEYNEEAINWLINHGYDIGNHTTTHPDFTTISTTKTQEVVGKMYEKLDSITKDYVKIVALPFGSPYKKSHANYPYILKGVYNGINYETEAILRVGWEPELSPFDKSFDKTFLKRCRAYDNNGKEFDITMVFKNLENNRYISDGNKDKIVIRSKDAKKINADMENVYIYEESV